MYRVYYSEFMTENHIYEEYLDKETAATTVEWLEFEGYNAYYEEM